MTTAYVNSQTRTYPETNITGDKETGKPKHSQAVDLGANRRLGQAFG